MKKSMKKPDKHLSGSAWNTNKCGRCGEAHSHCIGMLDENHVEYIVCEKTNKRMNIVVSSTDLYPTIWKHRFPHYESQSKQRGRPARKAKKSKKGMR